MVMKHLLHILLFGILASCGVNRIYTEQENQSYQQLKDLVHSKKLEIRSDNARPLATSSFSRVANTGILGAGNSAANIDISGNSNALRIVGDSVSGYFPYYGEIQTGGGYPGTNHQGIEFSGIPKNYKVVENDTKHIVEIQFQLEDQFRNNEHYTIFITLFPSMRSTIQINSTNRTSIEYLGMLQNIKTEDKKLD